MEVDPRIRAYREAALAIRDGNFGVRVAIGPPHDEISLLGEALAELGDALERKFREIRELARVTEQVNAGLILDDVLEHVYHAFRPIIPYDRIGFALLEEGGTVVRARWARSEASSVKIGAGYASPIAGSSLDRILATGQPRILNDLEGYLADHPRSESTRLIVEEGMRSSLTCPLVASARPIGFMFFSSMSRDAYRVVHVESFQQIADQLAVILEKSRVYQELVELNEVKDRFLGMAVHDLRTPLTVIRGYAALLEEGRLGDLSTAQRDVVARITRSSETMLALVEDLLDVSAIESGHLALDRRPVDVAVFLRECCASSQVLADAKDITLDLDVPAALPPVPMDPHRMEQVVSNLLANALKFSWPGGVVTVSARVAGDALALVVTDRGQGIPAGEMDRLFTLFGRTSVRPTAGEPTSGLGLAIAKRIVEAHGGSIAADSRTGDGARFTVKLPLAAPRS